MSNLQQLIYFSNNNSNNNNNNNNNVESQLIECLSSVDDVDEATIVVLIDFFSASKATALSPSSKLKSILIELISKFALTNQTALMAQRIDMLNEPLISINVVNRLENLKTSALKQFLFASIVSLSAQTAAINNFSAIDFLHYQSSLINLLSSYEPFESQATRLATLLTLLEPNQALIEQLSKIDRSLIDSKPLFNNDLSMITQMIAMISGEGFWIDHGRPNA